MTGAIYYPPADRTSQWLPRFGGVRMSKITKLVLHSTESASWPGYPSFAPQFTYNPWSHQWRQHMPVNLSASTLADPSSTAVRENRDNVCQVEIVGYCDPARWPSYGHNVEQLDDRAYAQLGAFAEWLHDEWGLPLRSTVTWVSYPKSYGANASQRLSGPGYDTYTGILGHQHASGNDHGDPGKINIQAILAAATGEDDMPLTDAEIRKIAEAVWNRDGIPNWLPDKATNPNVQSDNALYEIGKQLNAIKAKLDKLT